MKTRIYIATSEGPSEVQSLIEEDSDIACAVCLNGSIKALPITRDYNAFVRKPTGVIEKMTGHKSYRIDVSHPITNGESWQLGIYLAHALALKNELALEGENADCVWLVTGAVSARDELVQSVSHIQQKLTLAKDMLLGYGKEPKVTYILPASNHAQLENDFGINIMPVTTAHEALHGKLRNRHQNKSVKKMVLWAVAATFLIAVVALGQNNGFLNGMLEMEPSNDGITTNDVAIVDEVTKPSIVIPESKEDPIEVISKTIEENETSSNQIASDNPLGNVILRIRKLVPADGQSCAGRKYRGSKLQSSKIQSPWDAGLIDTPSICGVRVILKNNGVKPITLNVEIDAEQSDLLRRRDAELTFKGIEIPIGQDHIQDVNFSLYRSGDYQLNVSYGVSDEVVVNRQLQLLAADKVEAVETKYQ